MIRSFSLDLWMPPVEILEKLFARHVATPAQELSHPETLQRHLSKAQPYAAPGRPVAQTSITAYLYNQAQDNSQRATIVVLKEQGTEDVVGSAILYQPDSIFGRLFPLESEHMGGVAGMMISDDRQPELIAQALLVAAAEQLRERGFAGCCVFVVSVDEAVPQI
jgi:hypothetical protein